MTQVDMDIAEAMNELSRAHGGYLRDHHGQQGIGGDIERDTQEEIRASLVEVTGKAFAGGIELEQAMAGGQFHLLDARDVPRAHDQPPAVGVRLYLTDDLRNLI